MSPIYVEGNLATGKNLESVNLYGGYYATAAYVGGNASFTKGFIWAGAGYCGIKVEGDVTVDGGEVYAVASGKPDYKNGTGLYCGGKLTAKSGYLEAKYTGTLSSNPWYCAEIKGGLDINYNKMYVSDPNGMVFKDNTFYSEYSRLNNANYSKALRVCIEEDGSTSYPVWVGGIKLTENKSQNVTGLTGGLISYDNGTKTITMNDVKGFIGDKDGYGIYAEQDIKVTGTADVESGTANFGFIKTTKKLDVTNADIKVKVSGSALRANGDLNITESNVNVTSTGVDSTAIASNEKINVESGNLKASAANGVAIKGNKGLDINIEKLQIVKPEGGKVSNGTVVDGAGKTATYVETAVVTPYDVWVGNVRVTGANYEDVLGNGKVSYSHGSKTLTLNDLKTEDIDELYKKGSNTCCIYSEQELQIVGTAELSGADYCIYQEKGVLSIAAELNIDAKMSCIYHDSSEGWLNFYGGKGKFTAEYWPIRATGGITFYKGEWEATSTLTGLLAWGISANKDIEVKGGKITSNADLAAFMSATKIILSDEVDIYLPEDGKLNDKKTIIVDKDGVNAKSVLIDKMLTKYPVGFNANGHGTAPAVQNVREGFKVKDPGVITAAGFTFTGWYEEKTCATLYDFDTPVTGPLTLYAGWLDNSKTYYKVKFDLNGHGNTIDLPSEQTVEEGQTASEPAQKPFEAGFIFKGWATEKTGTTPYVFSTPVNSNLTLYAIWQPETPVYSVKFEMNGHGGMAPATQYIEEGKTAAVPEEPTDAEYTFVGWFVDENCTTAYDFATPVTANVTLYAGWVLKVSALNPVPVIKAGDTSITLVKGQKFTLPGAPEVKWETTNKKFVAINKKGVLTAKKVTEAPVEIKDGTRTVKVTVVQPKFAKKAIKATVTDLTPVSLGFDAGSAEIPVAYYSNSPSVVQVVGDQYIALGKGSATVTAYVNGKAYTCRISVKENTPAVERLLLMNVNDKKQLNVPGVKIVEWSCDPDPDPVIELSGKKNDKVKGLKPGHAEVTGKDKDGKIYKVYVNVEDITITSIGATKTNKYSVTLKAGETKKIEFAGLIQPVIFKSSKGEVAFADEYGIIRAQKAGKSKLTAKINKKSVTINVIVE